MELLTTQQAADALGVTPRRIRALIAAGRLDATLIGRDWLINPHELEKVRTRKPGYPAGRKRGKKGDQEDERTDPALGG